MNHVVADLVRYGLFSLLAAVMIAGTAGADWTYDYADDFSINKAQNDAYLCSTFWTSDATPLPRPYLFYLDTSADRGLVFMDYKGQLAELGYAFPVNTVQAQRIVEGVLEVDVSFPCNVEVSQFPPGQLFYSISADGAAWSSRQSLRAGHHQIPIGSPEGTCYVRFTGSRAMISSLRVSLDSPAATIRVPQDFRTIQQAIDAARTGDVVEVAPGTYTGAGNWDIQFRGKRITLCSASGPQNTIIDCGKPTTGAGHRGFYFHQAEGTNSVLSGFTIRGGRISGSTIPASAQQWSSSPSHPIGGGIYCEFSSPSIVNCIIEDCGAELGGGIGCVGGDPAIINCIVRDCVAGGLGSAQSGGRGAGIALVGRADAKITNCVIQSNSGHYNSHGAGIYCLQSTAVIAGCTIFDNLAPGTLRGGGVYCGGDGANITLKNCIISQNTADAGAGVLAERNAQAAPAVTASQRCRISIVNCTVAHNRLSSAFASSAAGGVESSGADITITNSIVWYNGGMPLTISGSTSASPVTWSDIQRGYSGTGNISDEPMFASSAARDYHLQSVAGRYDPWSGRWLSDSVHSPCIDAGDPRVSADNEPQPNGGRINMGAYGGTRWASKGTEQIIFHVDAVNGRDWNSGLSKTRAFASLQRAINTAQDGDAILVWPGVYREEVTFNRKAILMQSAADAAVLTAPNGYAVSFYGDESSRSILANFVITDCGEGGIYCDGASPLLTNLTIIKNQFGIASYGGADPNIVNCILWDNDTGHLFQCKARYSCIEQTNPDRKVGNINANPLFADSANGDYHLRSRYGRYVARNGIWVNDSTTSPCIDAGDPQDYPREERVPNGSRINMGAYGGTPFASMSSGPRCN